MSTRKSTAACSFPLNRRFASRLAPRSRQIIGLAVCAIFCAIDNAVVAAAPYSAVELQETPGFVGFYTSQLGPDGSVPGYSRRLQQTPEIVPTVWSSTGAANFLDFPSSGVAGTANAINPQGDPVGSAR